MDIDLGMSAGVAGGLYTNKKNQEFAEEMASTQYQRAVSDMKAAGLNPMAVFSSGGGSPAASPGGQMTNPAQGIDGGILSTAKSAVELGQQNAAKEQTEALTEVTKAKADETRANAKIAQNEAEINTKETQQVSKTADTWYGKTAASVKHMLPQLSMLGSLGTAAGKGIGAAFGGYASAKQGAQDRAERLASQEAKREHERDLVILKRDANSRKGAPTFYTGRGSPSKN